MSARWKSLSPRARLLRALALLWWVVVFPVVLAVLAYTAVTSHRKARALLDDHSIAEAVVSIDADAEPSERLARFKYTFEVAGKRYDGTFSTLKSRAADIEPGSTVPIAYANSDPSRSQRPEVLADNADAATTLKSFLTFSALTALLIGLFHLFLRFLIRVLYSGP